jgi:hypothetical protein
MGTLENKYGEKKKGYWINGALDEKRTESSTW